MNIKNLLNQALGYFHGGIEKDHEGGNQKSHARILRHRLKPEMKDYFSGLGVRVYSKLADEHKVKRQKYLVNLAKYEQTYSAWKKELSKYSFFQRFFKSKELPVQPAAPDQVPVHCSVSEPLLIDQWIQRANMEEFLIGRITEYPLLPVKTEHDEDQHQTYDVTPDDVKLLAP